MSTFLGVAVLVVAASVVAQEKVVNAGAGDAVRNNTVASASSTSEFPIGKVDAAEPSGEAPPGATAMSGYKLTYTTDFTGSALPAGWSEYSGSPGAMDPGSQWATTHDVVGGGLLSLNTWQDPAYGNEWVTGGVSQSGVSRQYGAYFVRSRETGAGPTLVELLWPANNSWPPEIDFDETAGPSDATAATSIWGPTGVKNQVQNWLYIDMTQWNTFGVVWTPTSITYTVNGRAWWRVTNASEISAVPMNLDLQQQTWCGAAAGMDDEDACPTAPESMQIDWVAEYSAAANYTKSVGTFGSSSWALNTALRTQISQLAAVVDAMGDPSVDLVGYSDSQTAASRARVVSQNRAQIVRNYLLRDLKKLSDNKVAVKIAPTTTVNPTTFTSTPAWRARNGTVVVKVHLKAAG